MCGKYNNKFKSIIKVDIDNSKYLSTYLYANDNYVKFRTLQAIIDQDGICKKVSIYCFRNKNAEHLSTPMNV